MDILLSFFVPSKMRRFRNMSGVIAVVIFVLATYLFIIPIKYKFSKPDKVITTNAYLSKNFTDAESNFDYTEIKANNYVISNEKLGADVTDKKVYAIDAVLDNNNYKFYFVFDLAKENYEFTEDLYSLYEVEKDKSSCLILFTTSFYELQTIEADKDDETKLVSSTVQGATYKECEIDFASYNNANELLDGVGYALAKLYGNMYVTYFTFTSALMIFLLPLGLILIMWLLFRKNGSLKRFKEYYNVAAIASIVPTLIAFGVSWFWPQVVNFYVTVFMIYFLFVIMRINAIPIEEDKTVTYQKQN